jgi:hypothetical protein
MGRAEATCIHMETDLGWAALCGGGFPLAHPTMAAARISLAIRNTFAEDN